MRSINIRIRHQYDLAIPALAQIKLIGADSRPQRADNRPDFLMREHLLQPRLFYIQNFALQRQNGLYIPVSARLGSAAG
jgi:hypothetical protein